MNSYSVTFGFTQYLVQHSMNNPEGKKTTFRHYLPLSYSNSPIGYILTIEICLNRSMIFMNRTQVLRYSGTLSKIRLYLPILDQSVMSGGDNHTGSSL